MAGAEIVSFEAALRSRAAEKPRVVSIEDLKERQSIVPFADCHAALSHVTVIIKSKAGKVALFHDLSVAFPKGRKIVILGHRGSGKTTLISLLLRRKAPNHGAVHINSRLSWPAQTVDVLEPRLTFRQNVMFVATVLGIDPTRFLDMAVQFCELRGGHVRDPVRSLHPAIRKRLAFLMLMSADFDCHLFDSPFRGAALGFDEHNASTAEAMAYSRDMIATVSRARQIPSVCDLAYILYDGRMYMFNDVAEAGRVFEALPTPKTLLKSGPDDQDFEPDEFREETTLI